MLHISLLGMEMQPICQEDHIATIVVASNVHAHMGKGTAKDWTITVMGMASSDTTPI